MLKRYLLFFLVVIVVAGCSKDKLESKPAIDLKSINSTEVFPGMDLLIVLEYRDKEGDLGNGTITYIRNRLNAKPIPDAASNDKADTITTLLPEFPKTSSGDIQLRIVNGFLSEDPFDNDTMNFKIFVKDVAGNVSDTLLTENIVERQN
jgi:hypothetical protein